MSLNSPMSMGLRFSEVETDPFNLISNFINKNVCFITTSNILKYFYFVNFLFHSFWFHCSCVANNNTTIVHLNIQAGSTFAVLVWTAPQGQTV